VRFWAFLGNRQGDFENTGKKLSAFPKKSPGNCFFGGDFFPEWHSFTFFSLDFFIALVKRLSVSRI
jgi:hypothetical protein